jgi:ribosomal protein L12E/L44/L45/RPP1/RPP2
LGRERSIGGSEGNLASAPIAAARKPLGGEIPAKSQEKKEEDEDDDDDDVGSDWE